MSQDKSADGNGITGVTVLVSCRNHGPNAGDASPSVAGAGVSIVIASYPLVKRNNGGFTGPTDWIDNCQYEFSSQWHNLTFTDKPIYRQ